MKKTVLSFILAIGLAGAMDASTRADTAAASGGIAKSYQKLCIAYQLKNAAGILAVVAPNFQGVKNGVVQNRAEFASATVRGLKALTTVYGVTGNTTNVKLKNPATATSVDSMTVHAGLKENGSSKLHDVRATIHTQDTWVNSGRTWKVLRSVTLGQPVTILDGRTVSMQPRGAR